MLIEEVDAPGVWVGTTEDYLTCRVASSDVAAGDVVSVTLDSDESGNVTGDRLSRDSDPQRDRIQGSVGASSDA